MKLIVTNFHVQHRIKLSAKKEKNLAELFITLC